jgi:hypothetical protein
VEDLVKARREYHDQQEDNRREEKGGEIHDLDHKHEEVKATHMFYSDMILQEIAAQRLWETVPVGLSNGKEDCICDNIDIGHYICDCDDNFNTERAGQRRGFGRARAAVDVGNQPVLLGFFLRRFCNILADVSTVCDGNFNNIF